MAAARFRQKELASYLCTNSPLSSFGHDAAAIIFSVEHKWNTSKGVARRSLLCRENLIVGGMRHFRFSDQPRESSWGGGSVPWDELQELNRMRCLFFSNSLEGRVPQ